MTQTGGWPSLWRLPESGLVHALGERLLDVPRIRITGTLHRAVYADLLRRRHPKPLYYKGSVSGRRYTPPGGPAGLYVAFDPATPAAELRLVVFEHGWPVRTTPHDPVTTIAIRSRVGRVLDLTDQKTRRLLSVTQAMLLADWERQQKLHQRGRGRMPATQLLALAAHSVGTVTGIKYPSARAPFGHCLVVFPDRLRNPTDLLEVVDSTGHYQDILP
jgi:hypothetical protein